MSPFSLATEAPQTKDKKNPLPFHKGYSKVQNIHISVIPEQTRLEKDTLQGARARDIALHPLDWTKYHFTGEHLMGSIMLLMNMYATFEGMRSGRQDRKVTGDWTRQYSNAFATLLTGWAFLCERGAKTPEGDNFWERSVNTLKHPAQSNLHFSKMLSFVIGNLKNGGDLYYGYREGGGIGRSRITQAGFSLSMLMLNATILATDDRSKHKALLNESGRKNPIGWAERIEEIYRYAWEVDKGGLVGSAMGITKDGFRFHEALMRVEKEKQAVNRGGSALRKSAVMDLLVDVLQDYYEHSRLYKKAQEEIQKTRGR